MVPGESSSPETSLRRQNVEENDSERELHGVQPPRSATIGADTPPIETQMVLTPLSVSPNLGTTPVDTLEVHVN